MSVVLGIDLATGDARVLAVDAETGEHLAEHSTALPTTSTAWESGSTREQPAVYAEAVFSLISAVVGSLGARSTDIVALSTTGTSGTVVPADGNGRPVGNALLYNDPRGAAELAALADAGLGIRPSGALARAAWIHTHTPAPLYLFTPDVVAAALAGHVLPGDTSHALKSGIDAVAAAWDTRALDVLGLPLASLPSLVAPATPLDVVSPAVATRLGLPAGVLIVAGMTDGSTAQLATGAVRPGDTVGVLGTTLVLKAASRTMLTETASGIYSHVAPDGTFWAGGASNTGAGVLRHGPTAGLDVREADRAAVALGVSPVVAYPLAGRGERFPVVDAAFDGFSVDLVGAPYSYADAEGSADPAVVRFRAVLEGVAFVERLGIERLAALAAAADAAAAAAGGGSGGHHHLGGGASGSAVWNTIRASVLGRPVVVPGNRSSAFGAAMLAAAGLPGETFQGVIDRLAAPGRFVDPDPTLVPALDDRYALFGETIAERLGIALPGASGTGDTLGTLPGASGTGDTLGATQSASGTSAAAASGTVVGSAPGGDRPGRHDGKVALMAEVQRVCFQLQVNPARLDEYRRRHAAVWPEFLVELRRTGWRNYSLFLRDDGLLIGYFETHDLRAAQAGMAATAVNDRWQSEMAEFFEGLEGTPDQGFLQLTEIFNLDDQLEASGG